MYMIIIYLFFVFHSLSVLYIESERVRERMYVRVNKRDR